MAGVLKLHSKMTGVLKEGTDGNVLAATAKQVSKSTIQLVLACQVFCFSAICRLLFNVVSLTMHLFCKEK